MGQGAWLAGCLGAGVGAGGGGGAAAAGGFHHVLPFLPSCAPSAQDAPRWTS